MSSLELALPSALLASSLSLDYAAPVVTSSVISNHLNTSTGTAAWGSTHQEQQQQQQQLHTFVNGTSVPSTAITTVLQCHLIAHQEEQQEQGEGPHQAGSSNCLRDTAVQQTAGGGEVFGESSISASVAAAAAATTESMAEAEPSAQEKWWGYGYGSFLLSSQEDPTGSSSSMMEEAGTAVVAAVEDKTGVSVHPTAAMAALWANLAILSGAMTVAVGVILWQ